MKKIRRLRPLLFRAALSRTLPVILSRVGRAEPGNPSLAPTFACSGNFPRMLLRVAADEISESHSEPALGRAPQAGMHAASTPYGPLFHAFRTFGPVLPQGPQARKEAATFSRVKFPAPPAAIAVSHKGGQSGQPKKADRGA